MMDPTTQRRPLVARILIAAACIYGPFVVAPLIALAVGCTVCAQTWVCALPILPGCYPMMLVADALGGIRPTPTGPLAASLIATWVLATAWLARESRAANIVSGILATTFATAAVVAYTA